MMSTPSVDSEGPPGQVPLDALPQLGEIRPANGAHLTLHDRDGEFLLLRHRAGSWADQGPSIAATVKHEPGKVLQVYWDAWHRQHRLPWKRDVEQWIQDQVAEVTS